MRDFKQLRVWQEAVRLTQDVYRLTTCFPKSEAFGLTAQLRRASVSISSNIAEGCGRDSTADFARFLRNALGSCREVESQLILVDRLQLTGDRSKVQEVREPCEVVGKMLYAIIMTQTRMEKKVRRPQERAFFSRRTNVSED